ncbi:telomerase reverse transcriptase [Quercus suber]|uniref:Telomerase reverse transcriptase n=1 Tax=Quercus suber TaxID=58331 RepID=A0AAW0K609_QUESU
MATIPPPHADARFHNRITRFSSSAVLMLVLVHSDSEAMSFLVRKEDPQEYVKLLNKCFVVIVQRTIEIMMHEQFNSINVGDDVMVYLLKYTSIFLPFLQKYHQVTGPPISDL